MDPGKMKELFISDNLKDMNISLENINLRSDLGLDRIRSLIGSGKYTLVFSGGADKLHNILGKEIQDSGKNIKFAATNNSPICCGEGICGACTCKIADGREVKMCKCQVSVKEALKGGTHNG